MSVGRYDSYVIAIEGRRKAEAERNAARTEAAALRAALELQRKIWSGYIAQVAEARTYGKGGGQVVSRTPRMTAWPPSALSFIDREARNAIEHIDASLAPARAPGTGMEPGQRCTQGIGDHRGNHRWLSRYAETGWTRIDNEGRCPYVEPGPTKDGGKR